MPEMTISEAAQWTGKERSTLFKAIQKGRISGRKTEDGQWMIDPAELARVYPQAKNVTAEVSETIPYRSQDGDMAVLKQFIAHLEKQLEDAQGQRDRLLSVVENQTRLITHLSETASEPARRSFWQRLRGKA
jgi:hypothetical protein